MAKLIQIKFLLCFLVLFSFPAMILFGADIDKSKLTGTWHQKYDDNPIIIYEIITFISDGTWMLKTYYNDPNTASKKTVTSNGKWKLVDDKLILETTWSEIEKNKGKMLSAKLISVDEQKIVYTEDTGKKRMFVKKEDTSE